jgi:hypothetical protein
VSHRHRRPPPHSRPAAATPTPGSSPAATPPRPRDIGGFIDAVADGEFDRHIDALAEAVSRRVVLLRAAREAILMATLRKGDRVRINHSARPQYLHGQPGTVIDWAGDNVVVRLDEPVGRFVNGEVRCPPGVLEPLVPGPE